jgi:hypothetical protein
MTETRLRAMLKTTAPWEVPPSSPTTGHLPILRPLTISGSGEACGHGGRQVSWSLV